MMDLMLAELHGRLDLDGGVAADRSEDLLTDAVFGTLRYLPYDVPLAEVLKAVGVKVTKKSSTATPSTLSDRVGLLPAADLLQRPSPT